MNPLSGGLLGLLGGAGLGGLGSGSKPGAMMGGGSSGLTSALGLGPMGFLQMLQNPSPYSVLGMMSGGAGQRFGTPNGDPSGALSQYNNLDPKQLSLLQNVQSWGQPGKAAGGNYDNFNPMQLSLLQQILSSLKPRV